MKIPHNANDGRFLKNRRRQFVVSFIVVGLGGISTVALDSHAGKPGAARQPALAEAVRPAARMPTVPARRPQAAEGVPVELVTAQPWGFDPPEIIRPPGPFSILVQNCSGPDGLNVSLSNAISKALLNQAPMAKGKTRRFDSYDLQPGEYVLSESAHPKWTCKITITPN